MEKPTGVIQKIIESLQQVNALDVYSPIEKDIILHNLRAAYMIFLNVSVKEESTEDRVERLFVEEKEEGDGDTTAAEHEEMEKEEEEKGEEVNVEAENLLLEKDDLFLEKVIEEEIEIFEEEIIEEEITEEKPVAEEFVEEEIVEKEIVEKEIVEEEFIEEEVTEVPNVTPVAEEMGIVIEVEEEIIEEEIIEEEITKETFVEIKIEEPSSKPIPQDDILEFIPDAQPQSTLLLFEETTIIKSEKKSLNDLLTEKKEDHSLGAHFQQSCIPDLTKAIAINEKFTFIRELFRNSGVDFSDAIQKLNECENIETAFDLMEKLKHQYLWDTTSSTYLSLCDLVRRRFLR